MMNKLIENIYFKLPFFLKNTLVSLVGKKNFHLRKGGAYNSYLNIFRDLYKKNLVDVEYYQIEQLKKLLNEAAQYSPFYQSYLEEKKEEINSIKTKSDAYAFLESLPFLTKTVLNKNTSKIFNRERKSHVANFTSGTTGSPMTVYYDKDSLQKSFALWSRFHYNMGLPASFKTIRLSGRIIISPSRNKPPFWVYNATEKQLLMSTYHLTSINIRSYIKKINSFKPQLIDGYPSAIYVIAEYIIKHNIILDYFPIAISTTAETLYSHHKKIIEKAFNTKVYNQYASSEGGSFITECREGNLHINIDSGFFEFYQLGKDVKAKPGEMAELVMTSFRQFKTPLIRYRSGDVVKLPEQELKNCPCGCQMPIVEQLIGRQDDILYTEEKGYVGRMDPAYKGLSGIVKSQIVQKSLNTFHINQEVDASFDKSMEALLLRNLRNRLGEEVIIEIKNVKKIPLSSNGKFRAVIREINLPK